MIKYLIIYVWKNMAPSIIINRYYYCAFAKLQTGSGQLKVNYRACKFHRNFISLETGLEEINKSP